MKERPILFNGPMVRAILASRKTQTRRVVKPQPILIDDDDNPTFWCWKDCQWTDGGLGFPKSGIIDHSLYGISGDRLWVREGHCKLCKTDVCYGADGFPGRCSHYCQDSSDDMPRRASRITLEVTGVRVERLQDISEEDAKAEGAFEQVYAGTGPGGSTWTMTGKYGEFRYDNAAEAFAAYWDSINVKNGFGWDANPWVWIIEFRRVENAV